MGTLRILVHTAGISSAMNRSVMAPLIQMICSYGHTERDSRIVKPKIVICPCAFLLCFIPMFHLS